MGLSHIGKIIGHCHSGFRCRVSGVSSKKVRVGLRLVEKYWNNCGLIAFYLDKQ